MESYSEISAAERRTATYERGAALSVSSVKTALRPLLVPLMVAELCVIVLIRWPLLYNFNNFAFWDWGSYLVAHDFLRHGGAPIRGFGWQYGLLPLLLQKVWFDAAGATPLTFMAISLTCTLIFTIVLAQFAKSQGELRGYALAVASLPFVAAAGADLPHALEPLLLCLGLSAQTRARRGWALALAAAACFTKPSMGYLYGFLLLIFTALALYSEGKLRLAAFARELVPAACTATVLMLLFVLVFGPRPYVASLLPLAGAHAYRILHFGLAEAGWRLFYFPGVKAAYYLGTPVIFWTTATLCLFGMAIAEGWRTLHTRKVPPGSEVVLTCALLQAGFLGFFYGSPSSWSYYAYVPVMGIILAAALDRNRAKLLWLLCLLAALANYGGLKSSLTAWRTMGRSAATAALYASPSEAAEWEKVASLTMGTRPAVFTWSGGAAALFSWVRPPAAPFLVPGVATDANVRAEIHQLRTADAIILPVVPGLGNPIENWPGQQLDSVLADTTLLYAGRYFKVYRRTARRASAPAH